MKVAYASDLHIGIDKTKPEFKFPPADMCILAGDILEVDELIFGSDFFYWFTDFLVQVSEAYPLVLWIPGNHEFYGSSIGKDENIVNKALTTLGINNILYGSKLDYTQEGVQFICATLWTDANKNCPITKLKYSSLNDSRYIEIEGKMFSADHMVDLHDSHKEFLSAALNKEGLPVIVVSHHAPVQVGAKYSDTSLDGLYYCSDMQDFILDNPRIKKWIYGHTHIPTDFMLGGTNIVSNPRGYFGYEDIASKFEFKVFEI